MNKENEILVNDFGGDVGYFAKEDGFTRITYNPNSSFISNIEHSYLLRDEKRITEQLKISFTDGKIVEYYQFEGKSIENIFNEMKVCESVGKYWHKHIKNNFHYKRIK